MAVCIPFQMDAKLVCKSKIKLLVWCTTSVEYLYFQDDRDRMMSLDRCLYNLQFPILFNIMCMSVKDLYLPFLVVSSTRSSTHIPYTIWLFHIGHFEWFAPLSYWLYDDVSWWYLTFPVYLVFSFFLPLYFIYFLTHSCRPSCTLDTLSCRIHVTNNQYTLILEQTFVLYSSITLKMPSISFPFKHTYSLSRLILDMLYDFLFVVRVDSK